MSITLRFILFKIVFLGISLSALDGFGLKIEGKEEALLNSKRATASAMAHNDFYRALLDTNTALAAEKIKERSPDVNIGLAFLFKDLVLAKEEILRQNIEVSTVLDHTHLLKALKTLLDAVESLLFSMDLCEDIEEGALERIDSCSICKSLWLGGPLSCYVPSCAIIKAEYLLANELQLEDFFSGNGLAIMESILQLEVELPQKYKHLVKDSLICGANWKGETLSCFTDVIRTAELNAELVLSLRLLEAMLKADFKVSDSTYSLILYHCPQCAGIPVFASLVGTIAYATKLGLSHSKKRYKLP